MVTDMICWNTAAYSFVDTEKKKFSIEIAHRSLEVDLTDNNLYGLCERIAASESLGFMAEAMNCVKPKIKVGGDNVILWRLRFALEFDPQEQAAVLRKVLFSECRFSRRATTPYIQD